MFKVKQTFSWAHRHVDVVEYQEGTEHDFEDADLIDVATTEGWIEAVKDEPVKDDPPAKATKAAKAAPENKAE